MRVVRCLRVAAALLISVSAWGGFPSSEQFLPAVGELTLAGGTRALTTIWATNLSGAPVSFTFSFLKQGQANTSPAQFTDSLAVGETKVYEDVVETKLGLTNVLGGAHVVSTGEILVAERIFNQAPGADLGTTQGLFFAGVPKGFSISAGQSASIQGLNQGGSENFRYNFALVETGGGSPTVNMQVFDGAGTLLGQKAFSLSPFEQIQPNVAEVVPGFSSINARITATVTGGTGSVLLAGAQVANESLDSSGFEMSFRDDLLGSGGTAGVTSLNGLTGALAITPGNGITITPSGNSIQVAFTGGGSSGITSVTHDTSLTGAGTGASPLAIANGQVVRSLNGLHDNVTLAAGSNVTITPSGNTLTLAASGGVSGGLSSVSHDATLAGDGTGGAPLGLAVPLNLSGDDAEGNILNVTNTASPSGLGGFPAAIFGSTSAGIGVVGSTGSGRGVQGNSFGGVGMIGFSNSGVGVEGDTQSGAAGVRGKNSSTTNGAAGVFGSDGTGLSQLSDTTSSGVLGSSQNHVGVLGLSDNSDGVLGHASAGIGVVGQGESSVGVRGTTQNGKHAVEGLLNSDSGNDSTGVFGVDGTGVAGITGTFSSGVRGESSTRIGVLGLSQNFAVVGRLKSGVQGELASHRNSADWALFASGNVNITGTLTIGGSKSFAEPHPTDPTKEIRFVCLEGPESGTYFRGSGHVVGGFAKIAVPESFRMVSDEKGLTVVATAVGGPGAIWVVRKNLDEIVLQANTDVEFDYVVNGVRRAYKDFEVIRENQLFIPDGPDDPRFAFYAPEIQRRLVATGIYNADGKVNLETAKRLGWDERWVKPGAE